MHGRVLICTRPSLHRSLGGCGNGESRFKVNNRERGACGEKNRVATIERIVAILCFNRFDQQVALPAPFGKNPVLQAMGGEEQKANEEETFDGSIW